MKAIDPVLRQLYAALEREPRVALHRYPLHIALEDGALVLEGEVASVAAKKLALEKAATAQVDGIVDRLRVAPSRRQQDGSVREALYQFLAGEPALRECSLRVWHKQRWESRRQPAYAPGGAIDLRVDDGVSTLEGRVISLSHKRLAGVLAWWTPGCRDVVNSLTVIPAEEDNDAEIDDALRLVLDKDPQVSTEQVSFKTHGRVVTLRGFVATHAEKRRVEDDAWCLFGVNEVVNRIAVAGEV